MRAIRILIASNQFKLCLKISTDLQDSEYFRVLDPVSNDEALNEITKASGTDVVLIDGGFAEDGFAVAERVKETHPHLGVILISEAIEEDTLHKVMAAGADDILFAPFEAKLLHEAVLRAFNLAREKGAELRQAQKRSLPKKTHAEVLTVFASKGGVGKTTTAINTAISLFQHSSSDVVLVDLDTDFGTAALDLNLQSRFTLADIVEDITSVNEETIRDYLTSHESGLQVLPAGTYPYSGITEDSVATIITCLRQTFDYVVIDLPARLSPELMPALLLSSHILLVTTPEINTLRNSKAALLILSDLGIKKEKIQIVLNRADSNTQIQPVDVVRTLEHSVSVTLRDDLKSVQAAQNAGKALVLQQKNGLSQDYHELSSLFLSEPVQEYQTGKRRKNMLRNRELKKRGNR